MKDKVDFHAVVEKLVGDAQNSEWVNWTEEQWDARDQEVAQANAVRDRPDPRSSLEDKLEALGWPRRALRVAAVNHVSAFAKLGGDPGAHAVVVLAGPPGTGKTVAAAAWALTARYKPRFVRSSSFAAMSRYNVDQRSELFTCKALVLDDLGAEYADVKGSFLVDLDELVDTFYGDERPLVITTNLNRESFRERYSDRIADRFRECVRWIAITGPSMRRSE